MYIQNGLTLWCRLIQVVLECWPSRCFFLQQLNFYLEYETNLFYSINVFSKVHPSRVLLLNWDNASVDYCACRYGWTALHYAAVQGQFDVVELLLARGADVSARDKDGATAAYRAQAAGHDDIICLMKSLVDHDDLLTVQPTVQRPATQPLYASVRKSTNPTGSLAWFI